MRNPVYRRRRRARRASGISLATPLTAVLIAGCARFEHKPLEADRVALEYESRSFAEEGLRGFLEANGVAGFWPRPVWDLESLTLAAFYFSPELAVARAEWSTADAAVRTAGQRPNPTASVAPQYDTTTATPSPWVVAVGLDVPIETAGKRAHRLARARHLSDAAQWNIVAAAWRVRGRLRRALVDARAASEEEELLAALQAAQAENVKLLEAQLAAGAAAPAEVTRERIALETARLAREDARRRRAESRVELAEVIGVPLAALDDVEISFSGLDRAPPELDAPAARRQALLHRADVLASLAEYAASEAALRLEIAKQYPDIHLNPGYEFDQGDNKWGVGLSLELPLLNQNQGPIAEAEARRAESAAKFRALQARVVAEIERGVAAYRAAREASAAAESILANFEKQERILQERFEAGDVSRGEVIAARVESAVARIARTKAAADAERALSRLEEAVQSPLPFGGASRNAETRAVD